MALSVMGEYSGANTTKDINGQGTAFDPWLMYMMGYERNDAGGWDMGGAEIVTPDRLTYGQYEYRQNPWDTPTWNMAEQAKSGTAMGGKSSQDMLSGLMRGNLQDFSVGGVDYNQGNQSGQQPGTSQTTSAGSHPDFNPMSTMFPGLSGMQPAMKGDTKGEMKNALAGVRDIAGILSPLGAASRVAKTFKSLFSSDAGYGGAQQDWWGQGLAMPTGQTYADHLSRLGFEQESRDFMTNRGEDYRSAPTAFGPTDTGLMGTEQGITQAFNDYSGSGPTGLGTGGYDPTVAAQAEYDVPFSQAPSLSYDPTVAANAEYDVGGDYDYDFDYGSGSGEWG